MLKTALPYVESVAILLAVGVPVHYFAGLDWAWAIVVGAISSIALRALIHGRLKHEVEPRPR